MKTVLWLLLALAFLWWSLGLVDFSGAGEIDDFCCVLRVGDSMRDVVRESEGGQMPSRDEFNRRQPKAADQSSRESDSAGQAPADKEGENHNGDGAGSPLRTPPQDVTPPGGSESGAAGRALAPPSAWLFGIFNPAGRLIGSGVNETADECQAHLDGDRRDHPGYLFSPCVEIRATRETL